MYNHFLDKLVEHGRCEFRKIRIAFHKLDKLVCFQPVGVPAFYLPLPFRYGRFQPGLFLVILIQQPSKMFVGYLARGVSLIQLFYKPVQLLVPLLCLIDFLLALLDGLFLVLVGRFPDALCKLLFVVPHIPAHALDNGGDGGPGVGGEKFRPGQNDVVFKLGVGERLDVFFRSP